MGMLSMMLMLTYLFISTSPLKFSFFIVLLSIWVSVYSLISSSVMFPSASIVISFSTGMMILFCYCASMVNFEKKNSPKKKGLMMLLLLAVLTNTEKVSEMVSTTNSVMPTQMQFLITAIMLVVISMMGINKCMFYPYKASMSIY